MTELKMTIEDLEAFIAEVFPQVTQDRVKIEELRSGEIRLRLPFREDYLRPGGTISGPTMMRFADQVAYLLVLSGIGPIALAVTTNLNINFLAKPRATDLVAQGRLLKLGKRLAVADVSMFCDGDPTLVAHATVTYSIPPKR